MSVRLVQWAAIEGRGVHSAMPTVADLESRGWAIAGYDPRYPRSLLMEYRGDGSPALDTSRCALLEGEPMDEPIERFSVISVRVSDRERERLIAAAAIRGLRVSTWLRTLGLGVDLDQHRASASRPDANTSPIT